MNAPDRRGVILPIALVCCLLLGALVFTFQFLSSSDYKLVGRLIRSTQASAIADLASDEIFTAIGSISYGSTDPKPTWLTALLASLESARSSAAGGAGPYLTLDVKQEMDFSDQVPQTLAAVAKTGNLVELKSAKAVVGPFWVRASTYGPKLFYTQTAFNDGGKDRYPWDLRAPFNVEVAMNASKGPLDFSQRYLRTQDLNVTDTTPPACEYALFGYMAPPNEDYAMNDLQRGGRVTVVPGAKGRAFLRGPLMLVPEEAPVNKPYMGTEPPVLDTPCYPQKSWTRWGTEPGPRVMQHPESSGAPLSAELGVIDNLIQGAKSGLAPRRPYNDKSYTVFITQPIVVMGFSVPSLRFDLGEISIVLTTGQGTPSPSYQTNDRDEIAYFPPSSYLYAPLASGKQTFAIVPRSGMEDMFRGALMSGSSDSCVPFENGTHALEEGDLLTAEPVPFNTAGACDVGLVGLYGTASVESKTFTTMTVRDVARWAIKRQLDKLDPITRGLVAMIGDLDELTSLALGIVGVDGSIGVWLRRFTVGPTGGWTLPTGDLFVSTLEAPLGNKEAVVAPYGYTFHDDGFWSSPDAPAALRALMMEEFKKKQLPWSIQQSLDTIFVEGSLNTGWQDAENAVPAGAIRSHVEVRDWLVGDHAKHLMRYTAGKDASANFDAVKAIFDAGLKGGVRGIAALSPERIKRPQGAFGDYAAPAPGAAEELTALANDYPQGFFPPKFRDWESIATRSYPDMKSYLAAETKNGVLELRGAVLIQKMDHPGSGGGPRDVVYQGRGIIIAVTEDVAAPATFDGKLLAASGATGSELILAHRVARKLVETGKYPPLKLGGPIQASVYSDTGVIPTGSSLVIDGNLVTGLLNKKAVPGGTGPTDGVLVNYREALGTAAAGSRVPYWTVELGGEVSSLEPGS